MKKLFSIFVVLLIFLNSFCQSQSEYPRVREAYEEKGQFIDSILSEKGLVRNNINILIVALKSERILEVYVKHKDSVVYQHLINYDICSASGGAGPKRKSGDCQVPEGFYHIVHFNPSSSFFLSLGINYPNSSDKILGVQNNLGGDIYIHGACCSIGCMAITDEKIKELYVLCLEAKKNGQTKIPVYIFPTKLDAFNLIELKNIYKDAVGLAEFWDNISEGYYLFYLYKKELKFSVNSQGKYIFTIP